MEANQAEFSVVAMCRVLEVCRRSYYGWKQLRWSVRELQDQQLLQRIRTIHADSRQTYGVRRVTAMLQRECPSIGRRRVHRLMRSAGLQGRMWRRRLKTTQAGTDAVAASDLVERCFERERLDEVWVADSTYIRVQEGFGYLAVVMDLCSKRIVGRSFSRSHDAQLMRTALRQATSFRQADGVIHHSDRGTQYASELYRAWCERHGIARSAGRVGNSYDNAPAESVFATIKRELPMTDQLVGWREMRDRLYDYIDRFYNCDRLHSSLSYLSPIEHERQLLSEVA